MKDEDFKKLEQLVDDLDHKVCGDDCNVCAFKANGFNFQQNLAIKDFYIPQEVVLDLHRWGMNTTVGHTGSYACGESVSPSVSTKGGSR